MAHWAKPGVRCVCLRSDHFSGPPVLRVRGVYTVREVVPCGIAEYRIGPFAQSQSPWLVLAELVNPYDPYAGAFCSDRFRPLVTRTQEQDLQHFAPLLVNLTSDEDA